MTFTVFTPTYNRACTLIRVWDSLCAQTFRDFEWLIVDDGSTDGTEQLVASWASIASFPIRYMKQPNAGKHIAMNRAVREAAGELFLTADSDDAFDADALETFASVWLSVSDRDLFAGVTARCRTQTGVFVGPPLPKKLLDSDNLELHYKYGVNGEKWGFARTDILRKFPCDERADKGMLPWARIAAAGYRTRYFEKVLRTYFVDSSDAMTKQVSANRMITNIYGNIETLNFGWRYFWYQPAAFIKAAINLCRFAQATKHNVAQTCVLLDQIGARALCRLMWPIALLKPVKSAA
jgi:glycosyltransferase involved in cell wall biosynthesis